MVVQIALHSSRFMPRSRRGLCTAREPPGILEAKVESLEELIKAKNENITDLQNKSVFLRRIISGYQANLTDY